MSFIQNPKKLVLSGNIFSNSFFKTQNLWWFNFAKDDSPYQAKYMQYYESLIYEIYSQTISFVALRIFLAFSTVTGR